MKGLAAGGGRKSARLPDQYATHGRKFELAISRLIWHRSRRDALADARQGRKEAMSATETLSRRTANPILYSIWIPEGNCMVKRSGAEIFGNLFVLELANNHWGSVDRGLKIIHDHAQIVRYNGVKAAIKLQFRDVERFIHPEYKGDASLRYVKKTVTAQVEWSFPDFVR